MGLVLRGESVAQKRIFHPRQRMQKLLGKKKSYEHIEVFLHFGS